MNQIVKISIISIFVLSVYFYLFSSGLIHFLALGSSDYFVDYFAFPKAVECYVLGFNPTTGLDKPECKGFDYGYALLVFAPFKNFIINSNPYTIPSIFIIIFTIITVKILKPKNYFQFIICLLALLNPSSLLLIERMNLDILLYLILILMCFNKIYPINWFLVIYSFLIKFHPFIFGIIIFVESKKRKIINHFFIFLLILGSSLLFMFIYWEEYSLVLKESGGWKVGLHYLFSIKAIAKVLKEAFSIHYGICILILYIIFFNLIYKNQKKLNKISNDDFNFEKKLFFISSNCMVFLFLTFSNAFYREVFLILTLPYLFIYEKQTYINKILYIFCAKYLYNFIYTLGLNFDTFYHIENIRYYEVHFLINAFIKGLIDTVLMIMIGSITLKMNIEVVKSIIILKKKN